MFRPQYPVLKVRRRRSPDAQGRYFTPPRPVRQGVFSEILPSPRGGPRGPAPPGPARLPEAGLALYPARRPRRGREGAVSTESRQTGGAARAGCGARGAVGGRWGGAGQAGCGAGGCGGAGGRGHRRGISEKARPRRDRPFPAPDATLAANPQHHGVRSAAAAGTSTVNDAANVR